MTTPNNRDVRDLLADLTAALRHLEDTVRVREMLLVMNTSGSQG